MIKRDACPVCRSNGLDRSGDNLIMFPNGSAHCYSCGYHVHGDAEYEVTKKEMDAVQLTAIDWKDKGLERTTLERYGVGVDVDGTLHFPYYNEGGALVAYKQRVDTNDGRDFYWHGTATDAGWFGLQTINPEKQSVLVLAEGESDTLAVAQATRDNVGVIGVAKGAATARTLVKSSLHILKRFKKIVIAFDNDTAGNEARQAVLELLPKHRTFVVNLPTGVKDMNEALLSGHNLGALVSSASPTFESVFHDTNSLIDQTLSMYFDQASSGLLGISTGFETLDSVTRGFIPGDIQVWVADTGVGKTTFTFELLYRAMEAGHKVMVLPLEMNAQSVMMKLTARHIRKPILSDPLGDGKVTREELRAGLIWVSERILIPKQFGRVPYEKFEEYLEISRDAHGVQLVLLDHVTAAATGGEGLDWKAIDGFVSNSKALMVRLNMTLLMVTHTTPDDKHDEGRRLIDLGDIRGSKSIAQYADVAFAIRRPEGFDSSLMEVRVIKTHRLIGKGGKFTFEQASNTVIEELDDAERDEKPAQGKRESSKVRQSTRKQDTSAEPETKQADAKDTVHDTAQVHSRLRSDSNKKETESRSARPSLKERLAARRRGATRDKGQVDSGGQAEAEVGSERTEGVRFSDAHPPTAFSERFEQRARAFAY